MSRIAVAIHCTAEDRKELERLSKSRTDEARMTDIFHGRIIDVSDKTYTIELTDTVSELDSFLQAIDRSLILETVRTGASGSGIASADSQAA